MDRIHLPVQERQACLVNQEGPLEKETAAHSRTVARESPWTEEPGRLVLGVAESRD